MKGVDLTKNIAITSTSDIDTICLPLQKHFDITYFNYVKLFKDGSRCVLTNSHKFTQVYYKEEHLFSTKTVLNMENLVEPSVHYFCEFRDQPSYVVARNEFDIDNGLTIINPSHTDGSTELFYFATSKKNYQNIYLYMSHLQMFYRFILYFKEKARSLIYQAKKERFFIPTVIDEGDFYPCELLDEYQFYSETQTNKLHLKLGYNNEVVLSRREVECLYLTYSRKTAKEIARILSISPRTVETYLLNLKIKTNCQTKSDLISIFESSRYRFLIQNFVSPKIIDRGNLH